MTYEVLTTPDYDSRFNIALDYRSTYQGLRSVRRLVEAQEAAVRTLSVAPFMGAAVYQDVDEVADDALRWISVGPYIAVYRVYRADGRVLLADLFYSSEDWRSKLLQV